MHATKVPMIYAVELTECGIACLAMICGAFKGHMSLESLRKRMPTAGRGMSAGDIKRCAISIGLEVRAVRLEPRDLSRLRLPAILHWDLDHFVVLCRVTAKWVELNDPARGTVRISHNEVARRFTGVALEFLPGTTFETANAEPYQSTVEVRRILGTVPNLRRSLLVVGMLAIVYEVFAIVAPLFARWAVDSGLLTRDLRLLNVIGVAFVIVALFQFAVGAARSWMITHVSSVLSFVWQTRLVNHMMGLPLTWFEARSVGDVAARMDSITYIERTLSGKFIETAMDGTFVIALLVVMFWISPAIAWVCSVLWLGYLAARIFSQKALRQSLADSIYQHGQQSHHLLESVSRALSVKLLDGGVDRAEGWGRLAMDYLNSNSRYRTLQFWLRNSSVLVTNVQRLSVVWIGVMLAIDDQLSIGSLMALAAYGELLSGRIADMAENLGEFFLLRVQVDRLVDIAAAVRETPGAVLPSTAEQSGCTVDIQGLVFRYSPNTSLIVDDCNLHIGAGEFVAIIGESGAGKSTLAKLILGLLEPNHGRIVVDGVDVTYRSAWRCAVGSVLQGDRLFTGSIIENIAFFAPELDFERAATAAKLAHIHDFITSLPMGYLTPISGETALLSGGEQQRMLLARALYRQPRLLFLDEATSNLDDDNEARISASINDLGMTRIVIAHRQSTLAKADRVYCLEAGVLRPVHLSDRSELRQASRN